MRRTSLKDNMANIELNFHSGQFVLICRGVRTSFLSSRFRLERRTREIKIFDSQNLNSNFVSLAKI